MWELDYKESWVPKNWWFWTVVLEKTVESPLDSKEIKPLNPKGNQPWIFIVRTGAKAETPILWPPDAKSWLTGKDPDDGKDWGQKDKWTTEDEMVGWHHPLHGHVFEQTLGDRKEQGSLVCCSPWGCKELDMTRWLKNNNLSLCVSLNSFWAEIPGPEFHSILRSGMWFQLKYHRFKSQSRLHSFTGPGFFSYGSMLSFCC